MASVLLATALAAALASSLVQWLAVLPAVAVLLLSGGAGGLTYVVAVQILKKPSQRG
jgi:hypothetical protein